MRFVLIFDREGGEITQSPSSSSNVVGSLCTTVFSIQCQLAIE